MQPLYEPLYRGLIQDLSHLKGKALPYPREIECCFRLCYHYWMELTTRFSSQPFKNLGEEIRFFKHIKPMFTSEMEYYLLLYHAQLFVPEDSKKERKEFWLREKGRLTKFMHTHSSFVAYYKKGCTQKDDQYFTRSATRISGAPLFKLYDSKDDLFSYADHLVSSLLSLEKYTAFIESLPYKR